MRLLMLDGGGIEWLRGVGSDEVFPGFIRKVVEDRGGLRRHGSSRGPQVPPSRTSPAAALPVLQSAAGAKQRLERDGDRHREDPGFAACFQSPPAVHLPRATGLEDELRSRHHIEIALLHR